MLLNNIDEIINRMKKLQDYKNKKAEKENRMAVKQRFDSHLAKAEQITDVLVCLKDLFNFTPGDKVMDDMDALMAKEKAAISSDSVDKTLLDDIVHMQYNIDSELSELWRLFYKDNFTNSLNVLNLVSSIDPGLVQSCISDIRKGEEWTCNRDDYECLAKGYSRARNLIGELELEDEIEKFLYKLNSNKATIDDLNEKIFKWIYDRSLQDKIYLKM